MPKPAYKELGISSKEYEEALLLERLFKLVKKNPCSTCLLKKPTHVDLDRFELLCTNCSKKCSSKLQIGKGLISMSDLERLEAIYDKSKKKLEHIGSKHKKHKQRSPSLSSIDSYNKYKKQDKYNSFDSDNSSHHKNKSKQKSKKKDIHRYQLTHNDYYPETYDKYQGYSTQLDEYPKIYHEDRYDQYYRLHKDKNKIKNKDRYKDIDRYRIKDGLTDRNTHLNREYHNNREQDREYPTIPNYTYYQPPHRYIDHYEQIQSNYKYPNIMNRNQTTYEYTNINKRDVPGMVGLLANKNKGQEMVLRNQWALPTIEDNKNYDKRKETKSQLLALTNGYQGFRSVPPLQKDDRISNNPFAKKTFEPTKQTYDFTNLREALNPPKTYNRYTESYIGSRDFQSNKLGNPGFPDSSANYYNRY